MKKEKEKLGNKSPFPTQIYTSIEFLTRCS